MQYGQFAGSWIHRSFVNCGALLPFLNPDKLVATDVEKWSRYLFRQGVMTFDPTVAGDLTDTLRLGDEAGPLDMSLQGKIEPQDGQTWFRWNACGIANTPT